MGISVNSKLVFLFFPGLIVFAPFVNLRLQGQGNH